MEWARLDDKVASFIYLRYNQAVTITDSQETLQRVLDWTVPNLFKFKDVVNPYVLNLQIVLDNDSPEQFDEDFGDAE